MELNIIVDVAQISATKPTTNFWTNQSFYLMQSISMAMIHYLKNKVGVVDFANAQGPEGPAGFEILPLRGLL